MGVLPYPILNEGGAIVVDSSRAAQVAWDSVHDNLDMANQLMRQKRENVSLDFESMNKLAEKSAVLDEEEINTQLETTRSWYAEQIGRGRNPGSSRFIAEFNEKMQTIQSLNGKAQASQNSIETNREVIDGLSGYYDKDKLKMAMIQEKAKPLSERNPDILPSLVDNSEYYDIDAKLADVADVYRQGLSTNVTGYERGGNWWEFSQTYNPAIHQIMVDPKTGKNFVKYELTTQAYDELMSKDKGFKNSVNGEVSSVDAKLKTKFADIVERESNGEVIPESEQMTEWEDEFLSRGNADQGRLLVSQKIKERVGTTMSDIRKGLTAEAEQALELEQIEARKQADIEKASKKPITVAERKAIEVADEQDSVYSGIVDSPNPEKILNSVIKEKETGGGVVRGTFKTEEQPDGTIKITYRIRSVNEYRYKNILREKTEYIDPADKGAVLNFAKRIGDKTRWTHQTPTGTSKLPKSSEKIVGEEETDDKGTGFRSLDDEGSSSGVSDKNLI